MTTKTDTAPTFPPCPSWCPGHVGDNDKAVWEVGPNAGRWSQACSHASLPAIDLGGSGYVQVGWGAVTFLNVDPREPGDPMYAWDREYGITIDSTEPDLSPDDARRLAADLLLSAAQLEAAERADQVQR